MLEAIELAAGLAYIHRCDVCPRRPPVRPCEHSGNVVRRTLHDGFDRTVAQIAHPAGHADAVGRCTHRLTKAYTLNAATHDQAFGDLHARAITSHACPAARRHRG